MRFPLFDAWFVLLLPFCMHCGAIVQPSGDAADVAHRDHDLERTMEDSSLADVSSNDVEASADVARDVARERNLSTVSIRIAGGMADAISARLLSDEIVPSSIDSTEGACRTLFPEMLPETPAGTLTVERLGELFDIEPATTRPRNLYTAQFPGGSPPGTRFSVRAAGSPTFPPFSVEAQSPPELTVTRPATRTELRWDSSTPVTIEWQPSEANHYVRLVLVGTATMTSGTSLVVRCTVPISAGRFTFQPEQLRRFEAFPLRRRIDVYRITIASGRFENAPIQLNISNEADGLGWIQFPTQ